ncbi:fungal-specific actin related protein [Lentinula edodes]|uniref:actin-domain-containing protein n=1 Tax=Lentinula edodes TaxID=5353 RepID=UPI001E8DBF19|nr:actin-domain-containing protein [Lentinula edodes]KAH7868394.1 actin-domain-containing protein [Lentinula edodes]KAJ3903966.1 fungal-specific actin related protein [Lentinula edodes]
MSTVPETPRSKTSFNPSTPTTSRITGSHVQSSPHYTTTRRHSLYGVEDRIIIDPGSLIWKVGFSGEGRPREVFYAGGKAAKGLWDLTRATDGAERQEEDKLLDIRLEQSLRAVFHDSLLTDPKARKVIIVENPLLPLHIKEALARILFGNLQVPSVSFASSHLLSLLAVGRITGLVLDCGNLESVALPIFAARPLFSQLRTTPLAGQRFLSHLRSLLLLFGTYVAPTSPGIANLPQASRSMRVPQEILTNEVLEEIKTRCCFVGESLAPNASEPVDNGPTPDDSVVSSDMDVPPTSDPAQSESEFSFAGRESGVSSQHDSSEYSVISTPRMGGKPQDRPPGSENRLQVLADMYMRHSTATDLQLRVEPPVSMASSSILGYGTIIIPGWIRERTAEVLFEGGDVDEGSLAEIILDALLKVPVDLRKTLASSILIVGGTSMLPGFIPRLHVELLRAISPPPLPPSRQPTKHDKAPPPHYDRYATLRPLIPYLSILNNPSPPAPLSDRAKNNGGKAPAFSPATMAWVGGSLAGALKTGGTEVSREKWDEADPEMEDTDTSISETPARSRQTQQQTRALQIPPPRNILPDWTRLPLPVGAPSVGLSSTSVKTVSPTALIPTSRARVGA